MGTCIKQQTVLKGQQKQQLEFTCLSQHLCLAINTVFIRMIYCTRLAAEYFSLNSVWNKNYCLQWQRIRMIADTFQWLSQRTCWNCVLWCAYGKDSFQRWINAGTNVTKRSLDISSFYLLTSFFHLYVFSGAGGRNFGWIHVLSATLNTGVCGKMEHPCAFHDLISYIAPPAPGLSYITI